MIAEGLLRSHSYANVSRETFLLEAGGRCFTWNIFPGSGRGVFHVKHYSWQGKAVFHVKHFSWKRKGRVSRGTFLPEAEGQCFT